MLATKETVRSRREICMKCPFMKKGWVNTCSSCGCPIKTKTTLADGECPEGYWSWQGDKSVMKVLDDNS